VKRCLSCTLYPYSWIKFLEYPLSQFKCMNWKDILISSIPFSRWYDPMWIMSISFIVLSVYQVFRMFLHNSQNWSIRFCKLGCPVLNTGYVWPFSPDSNKDFRTCPVILPDMSGLSAKFSFLDENLLLWFISPIYHDLCDHVKLLSCLNRKWIMAKEDLSWIIYLRDSELSFDNCWKKVKQPRFHQEKQDHALLRSP
jgi:hypothetical protein